jgi:lipoprotein signal peptidase
MEWIFFMANKIFDFSFFKSKFHFIILTPLIIIIVDQLSKQYAINQNIHHIKNFGVFMSYGNSLTDFLRFCGIASLSGVLILIYASINYLFIVDVPIFHFSLGTFFGGVLANTFDRIKDGSVVDFIPFFNNYFYNVADVFIVVGYFLFIYTSIKYNEKIWVKNCLRANIFINFREQLITGLEFALSCFISCLSLTLFTAALLNYTKNSVIVSQVVMSMISISTLFSLITFIFAIWISKKYYGPIKALRRYVEDVESGTLDASFRKRTGDKFHDLQSIALKISKLKRNGK